METFMLSRTDGGTWPDRRALISTDVLFEVKEGLPKLMDLLAHVKTTGWDHQFSIGQWDQTQIQKEWESKEVELLAQSLSLFSLKSELMPEGWKVASAVSIFK